MTKLAKFNVGVPSRVRSSLIMRYALQSMSGELRMAGYGGVILTPPLAFPAQAFHA